MAHNSRSKVVDPEIYLEGRGRSPKEEIMGRKEGDAQRLFPIFTHASAATTKEVTINGKVLKLWTFSQLESLNAAALRQRAMDIRDVCGEAGCPPIPSGRTQDLTRWILHMQEQLSQEPQQPIGRSGGYGTGHFVPPSFAQDHKDRPIGMDRPAPQQQIPFGNRPVPADLNGNRSNVFSQNGNSEELTARQSRRSLQPQQNMDNVGVSAADPQGIATLRDGGEGRRYFEVPDTVNQELRQPALRGDVPWVRSTPRVAAGGPVAHVSDNHFSKDAVFSPEFDAEDQRCCGERKRATGDGAKDHFLNLGTTAGQQEAVPSGRKYLDGFQGQARVGSMGSGHQDSYRSNWKKDPSKLLGSSMIV
mmetsp:Transcript_62209/g.100668  ORF Transcript_62209/g.100668 Transcript_62209/m.100668 type:complete len:361 (-) Transcript_62209:65-1147(-)